MMVTPPPNGTVTPQHTYWLDWLGQAWVTTWIPVTSPEGHHAAPIPLWVLLIPELEYRKQSKRIRNVNKFIKIVRVCTGLL